MPLGLPVRYIPEGMRLSGNSQNHFGIFRETCQVYFFTAPKPCGHLFSARPGHVFLGFGGKHDYPLAQDYAVVEGAADLGAGHK